MTALRLILHQPLADGRLDFGAVAELRQLLDAAGKPVTRGWRATRSVAVAGGGAPDDGGEAYARFDLPAPGRYGLSIRMPRGADIERELDIAAGEIHAEVIDLPASPHEYLGWQQYSGVVRQDPSAPPPPAAGGGKAIYSPSRDALGGLLDKPFGAPDMAFPRAFRVRAPKGEKAWKHLARAGDFAYWGGALKAVEIDDWASAQHDDAYCLWTPRLPLDDESGALVAALRGDAAPRDLAERFPRWLLVERDGQCDLASMPWVWWGRHRPDAGNEGLKLLHDRFNPSPGDPDRPGRTVLSVQDGHWGGLLEFIASGRLLEAAELADDVFAREPPEMALYEKLRGPMTAALGALVLVATSPTRAPQPWDRWLANLETWFPGIPDGAVLCGYRKLQLGRHREGRALLRRGVERGVPYFAATMRMLTLGLSQVEDDETLRLVSPLATQVDPTQPFTVIRLNGAAP